jgi:hypothetical protein
MPRMLHPIKIIGYFFCCHVNIENIFAVFPFFMGAFVVLGRRLGVSRVVFRAATGRLRKNIWGNYSVVGLGLRGRRPFAKNCSENCCLEHATI